VAQFLYYRSLSRSAAIWREGKEIKTFPPETDQENYLRHMKEGKGFPSIWQFSNNDDLERIVLGLMLYKGNLDKIELIGFDECCFEKAGIEVRQATNTQFPLPSVGSFHYELQNAPDTNLIQSIELFLNCNGNFKRFPKIADSATELSMLTIAKKYIKEIAGETHINKANEWIEKYG
jgi:hypothetical protein